MSNIPGLTVELNGIEYPNDFSQDVTIDRTDLEGEFTSHAEKYAYYATLTEIAKDKASRKKWELEQLEAVLDAQKRSAASKLMESNVKFKYTETMCHNEVITDPRYSKLKNEVFDAQLLANQLAAWTDAMQQKKDMLIQMGAHSRVGSTPVKLSEPQREHVKQMLRNKRETE